MALSVVVTRRIDGVELDAIDATLRDASALDAIDARRSLSPMKHGRRGALAKQTTRASAFSESKSNVTSR